MRTLWPEQAWRVAKRHAEAALTVAREVKATDPQQAARILRGCAELADFYAPKELALAALLRDEARELIERTGAKDQLIKL